MVGVRHILDTGICYFVTCATMHRRHIFDDPQSCQILVNVIYNLRDRGALLLAGFVVMPDHLHIALLPVDFSLPEIMRELKKGSSRLINMRTGRSGAIWQPGYWDRGVERQDELIQKLSYMAANPQRAGLVGVAEEYPWGTANPRFVTDLDVILGA